MHTHIYMTNITITLLKLYYTLYMIVSPSIDVSLRWHRTHPWMWTWLGIREGQSSGWVPSGNLAVCYGKTSF